MSGKFRNVLPVRNPSPEPDAPDVPTVTTKRKQGKRGDPRYEQISAYVLRETNRRVKKLLLDRDDGLDASELIEQLLHDWATRQGE